MREPLSNNELGIITERWGKLYEPCFPFIRAVHIDSECSYYTEVRTVTLDYDLGRLIAEIERLREQIDDS